MGLYGPILWGAEAETVCDITGVVSTLGELMVIILPGRDRGIKTLPTTDEVALWLDRGTGVESPLPIASSHCRVK